MGLKIARFALFFLESHLLSTDIFLVYKIFPLPLVNFHLQQGKGGEKGWETKFYLDQFDFVLFDFDMSTFIRSTFLGST